MGMEQLEGRRLYSTVVILDPVTKLLSITNDDASDQIVVQQTNYWVDVKANGVSLLGTRVENIAAADVSLNGGDDYFAFSPALPVTVHGGLGNDTIYTSRGNDELYGEDGDDFLYANFGSDLVDGGAGDDFLEGNLSGDTIIGGDGLDTANYRYSNAAPVTLYLDGLNNDKDGSANEFLGGDVEHIVASNNRDTIYGSENGDWIDAGGDNDWIYGYGGNDTIYAGNGWDHIWGGDGDDTIIGDYTYATRSYGDTIYGEAGNDYIAGFAAASSSTNYFDGGDGIDTIESLTSGDRLYNFEDIIQAY